MNEDSVGETAKAVQEAAKATSNALDKGAELLRFIGRIFGPSLENIGQISTYYTEYWKIKNALKMRDKVDEVLKKRGLTIEKTLPLRLGIPLLDAATNEDDESLQDLWANLLASAMSNSNGVHTDATKAYIETLKNLDVVDAKILNFIYIAHLGALQGANNAYVNFSGNFLYSQVALVINNLERLGLIKIHEASSYDRKKNPEIIKLIYCDDSNNEAANKMDLQFIVYSSVTLFGHYFMRSCTDLKLNPEGTNSGEWFPADERIEIIGKRGELGPPLKS